MAKTQPPTTNPMCDYLLRICAASRLLKNSRLLLWDYPGATCGRYFSRKIPEVLFVQGAASPLQPPRKVLFCTLLIISLADARLSNAPDLAPVFLRSLP